MTNEKEKAYEVWWFGSMGPLERDRQGIINGFHAGWEAHAAVTATSRTDERAAAEQVGREIEKECGRAEIMGRAYEAFSNGQDEKAKTYRELAIEIFGHKI